MEQIILVAHLLIALAIIGLIMMQRGKGSDIGASFGAGASQTLFGSAGSANALTRSTAWLVAVFFGTSFGLAVIADNKTSIDDDLGFELPLEAAFAPEGDVNEMPVLTTDAPDGDMPDVGMDAVEPSMSSDLPDTGAIDSDSDLPEG